MEITERDIERIPPGNIRVPVAEFVAVWRAAERQMAELKDWPSAGVVSVCRWLARVTIRSETGPWYLTYSPVTRSSSKWAHEEIIEKECFEAERVLWHRPAHHWLTDRPGWVEAIVETLNWVWRGSGRVPLGLDREN